jgi:4-carboxymuconolactone decarboxylase
MIRRYPGLSSLLFFLAAGALAQNPPAKPPKEFQLQGDRFKPLTWDEMTPPQKTMIDHLLTGERGGTGGPFNALLRDPEMGDIAQSLGAYIRYHSSLPRKLNEFAILLTGRYLTAQYEFYAHRPLALQAGLSDAIVTSIAAGKRPAAMQPDETAVYNFCNELLNDKKVSDPAFKAVVDQFGERGAVDLVGVVGYYHLVSLLLNVDRYPLPPGAKPPLEVLK